MFLAKTTHMIRFLQMGKMYPAYIDDSGQCYIDPRDYSYMPYRCRPTGRVLKTESMTLEQAKRFPPPNKGRFEAVPYIVRNSELIELVYRSEQKEKSPDEKVLIDENVGAKDFKLFLIKELDIMPKIVDSIASEFLYFANTFGVFTQAGFNLAKMNYRHLQSLIKSGHAEKVFQKNAKSFMNEFDDLHEQYLPHLYFKEIEKYSQFIIFFAVLTLAQKYVSDDAFGASTSLRLLDQIDIDLKCRRQEGLSVPRSKQEYVKLENCVFLALGSSISRTEPVSAVEREENECLNRMVKNYGRWKSAY